MTNHQLIYTWLSYDFTPQHFVRRSSELYVFTRKRGNIAYITRKGITIAKRSILFHNKALREPYVSPPRVKLYPVSRKRASKQYRYWHSEIETAIAVQQQLNGVNKQ